MTTLDLAGASFTALCMVVAFAIVARTFYQAKH
jgi:hypothetical protein